MIRRKKPAKARIMSSKNISSRGIEEISLEVSKRFDNPSSPGSVAGNAVTVAERDSMPAEDTPTTRLSEKDRTCPAQVIYANAYDAYKYFLDWREKIHNRFWILVLGSLVATYSLAKEGRHSLATIFFYALLPIGIGCFVLDYRVFRMSRIAARVCRDIEDGQGLLTTFRAKLHIVSPFTVVYGCVYILTALAPLFLHWKLGISWIADVITRP